MDKIYDDFVESKKTYLLKNHYELFSEYFKKKQKKSITKPKAKKAKSSKTKASKLVVSKLKKNITLAKSAQKGGYSNAVQKRI